MTTFTIILSILVTLIVWFLYKLIAWFLYSYKKTILYRDTEQVNWGRTSFDEPKYIMVKTPYLIRYTLLSCKFFTIKIHKALISDPNEPHDHPWNYLSIILKGGYWEEIIVSEVVHTNISTMERLYSNRITTKWYKPGSILYRKGDRLHKLIIPEGKSCISLIFTFKKWRKWGYLKEGSWKQYHIQ